MPPGREEFKVNLTMNETEKVVDKEPTNRIVARDGRSTPRTFGSRLLQGPGQSNPMSC
jgi:hypothetical protein